jgi:hypothetical protein
MAVGLLPTDALTQLRILVIHTNFAVGSAIVRRLIDAHVVTLSHSGAVLAGHQDPERYHAIVLGPYLDDDEREALLDACLQRGVAAVVELRDSESGSAVLLHRDGAESAPVADLLADALALPLAAG